MSDEIEQFILQIPAEGPYIVVMRGENAYNRMLEVADVAQRSGVNPKGFYWLLRPEEVIELLSYEKTINMLKFAGSAFADAELESIGLKRIGPDFTAINRSFA